MSTIRSRVHKGPLYTASAFTQSTYDKDLTRERLAADMDAFDKAGGHVEVLGITPLRRKAPKDEASPSVTPAPAVAVRTGSA